MPRVDELIEGRRIVICAGSGGVGKTTTSAAIALGMAALGLRACVVTIDPARRLATSLGLDDLGNEPARVADERFAAEGFALEDGGELWAMMLDSKRTFDDLIDRLAPDDATRDDILANRIYQELSSAVAGSQEFTAIAKLYDLDASGQFDLIVLDTPPSRNALDFLDAPSRLSNFFAGRAVKIFLRPAGVGGKLIGRGTGFVFGMLKRVTGVDLMQDLSVFFSSLGGIIDGFTTRASHIEDLLHDAEATFVLVTSPEREPTEEAAFFARKLREARMELGGLVVNRMRPIEPEDADVDPEAIAGALGDGLATKVAAAATEYAVLADRDATNVDRLRGELRLPDERVVRVPQFADDVHDVEGLLRVHAHLFGTH